ncbi:MAG: hypothetical protein ACMXYE_00925 [Candidatus Woesearchaeota archaeon]
MTKSRNKLIELFISNITNSVIHKVLEKAIDNSEIAQRYEKEMLNSFTIAMKYREQINPINKQLADKDIEIIQNKIIRKTKSELLHRINKGYTGINLTLVEKITEEELKKAKVIKE